MHCQLWAQIISSQLNLPHVDSNQIVEKDDRWSVKTGCTRAQFYGKVFENSSMYFLFLCLINLQEFPANLFHSASMGYCVQNHKIWMMWTLSGCISISNSIIIVFLMLSATTKVSVICFGSPIKAPIVSYTKILCKKTLPYIPKSKKNAEQ